MYFCHLKCENFLSVSKLDLSLQQQGLILLTGRNLDDPSAFSNGSGKSALIEAIYWCLYGKTLRKIRYADQVVNRKAKKNCVAQVVVRVKKGELRVTRFRKHRDHGNALHVLLNGEEQHATDPRVTQRILDNLLGQDATTFARLILVGQGFNLRFTEMNDRELKEFIEGMTGSLLYAKAYNVAKDSRDAAEVTVQTEEQTLKYIDEQIQKLDQSLQEAEAAAAAAEEQRDAEVAQKRQAIEELRVKVSQVQNSLQVTCAERDKHVDTYNQQITEWDAYIDSLRSQSQVAEEEFQAWRTQYHAEEMQAVQQFGLDSVYQRHQTAVQDAQRNIEAAEAARDETRRQNDAARRELQTQGDTQWRGLMSQYDTLAAEVRQTKTVEIDPQLHSAVAAAEERLRALDARIQQDLEKIGEQCPTCGQQITEASANKHIQERYDPDQERSEIVYGPNGIEQCRQRLKEAEERVATQRAGAQQKEQQLNMLSDRIKQLAEDHARELAQFDQQAEAVLQQHEAAVEAARSALNVLRTQQEDEIKSVQVQINALRQEYQRVLQEADIKHSEQRSVKIVEIEQAESSRNEVVRIRDDYVSRVNATVREYEGFQATYERDIAVHSAEIDKLLGQNLRGSVEVLQQQAAGYRTDCEAAKRKLDEAQDAVQIYSYLTTAYGLGGIRSYMLDSILSYLNERLVTYCRVLFDHRASIELSPVREQANKAIVDKITLVVTTDGGSYDASSGGERRKIDVALFLAFRDLNRMLNPIQVNLEAYDEILSNLDGEAASRVVQLLIADHSVETKILITHRVDVPIIGPYRTLEAVKSGSFTEYRFL